MIYSKLLLFSVCYSWERSVIAGGAKIAKLEFKSTVAALLIFSQWR